MNDSELKKLLQDAALPVLPGQEERAWGEVRDRLFSGAEPTRISFLRSWRGAFAACLVMAVALIVGDSILTGRNPVSFASASSQAPGIYATAFYSHTAEAQVVWLNGLEPSTDQLSYQDPTTVIGDNSSDSNGL